ncbi:MAG: TonB-dependent receptor [Thiomicrorhabdus sp.]|nr:TonB-dependent receptor [Thiomicrorhabdus sp.]
MINGNKTPLTSRIHPTPKKLSVAIVSLLATASMVHAQDSATQLLPITITDTAPAPLETNIPINDLLQTSNSETSTALRQINGVEASRMGGHGVDLIINGQQASQLNIFLDGAKIEGGCPNRMDPPTAYTELSSYDSVTVIKGVNSVTYGSGGSGGTVLFERNAPSFEEGKPYQGQVNVGTSSNGLTQDINATVAAGGDKGYIVLQGSKKSADNYTDGNGDEVRSSYESRQGHIDLGWTPNEDHEFKVSYEKSYIDDVLFQGATMDSPSSEGSTTRLSYKGDNISKAIQSIEVDLYASEVDHLMDNYTFRPATPVASRLETPSNVKTTGAKIQLSSQVDRTTLNYGLQVELLEKAATVQRATGQSIFNLWPTTESTTNSVFLEGITALTPKQKVIMGVRYENVSTQAKDASSATDLGNTAFGLYNNTYTNYSGQTKADENNLNALLRYEQTFKNNINGFIGLSRTHRNPDATELYMARGGTSQWVGNPDLKPEAHNQLDIGLSQTHNTYQWAASAYYDVVENYILRDFAQNQSADVNIAGTHTVYLNKDAVIYGLEASGQYQLSPQVVLGASANLTKGRNTSDNRNLSNIPPLSGALFAQYQKADWKAGARINLAAEQTDVNQEYGELETPAWSTVDLYGSYHINKTATLSLGVDNLFDHAYQNYLNRVDAISGNTFKVYEPGQTVWAKLSAKF